MISMNWVKDYVNIDGENLEELADKITKAGINVEHVVSYNINNLVIGEIIKCDMHPDSDHLHICKVNIGSEIKQIVCGANNVRKDLKVIVALPGAVLPGNVVIKESNIRGISSQGMICALYELGLEEKTEEAYNRGIEELDKDAPVGEEVLKYLNLDDTLYDLDTHKHKSNDCGYHIGFAYEVGTILGKKVKLPKAQYKEIEDNVENYFSLKVYTKNCTYYKAKMVRNLKIGESPAFIKNRLRACGMRPINNVVDISNYVMLEYGQPLHFYDKDKIGNQILVQMAKSDEEIITLDKNKRILTTDDIVINDGSKVCSLAGVMGTLDSEVDENTKTILIESAIFNPSNIRRTARRLNLRSEASSKFEKGLNFEYTDAALERACSLLEKYASGEVLSGTLEYDNEPKEEMKIEFTTEKINSLLGIQLNDKDVETQLKKLDFEYVKKNGIFITTIPRRRIDIEKNVNDIAEEIGRLYGYHNLKNTMPILPIKEGKYDDGIKFRKLISKRMRRLGLDEVRTYSIVAEKNANMFSQESKLINLPNPMSQDKTVLRKTLVPSLIDVVNYNKSRGLKDVNIYEISKVFYNDYEEENHLSIVLYGNYMTNEWQNLKIKNDFYILKGIIENLFNYLGLKNKYEFVCSVESNLHPGISADILFNNQKVGFLGRINPKINKDEIYVLELFIDRLNLKMIPLTYISASKYPSIKKDVAFIMPIDMDNSKVVEVIKNVGTDLLTDVSVFDLYVGDKIENNKKSIAYTLTFENYERTLTDIEVMQIFNNIIKEVETKLGLKLRSM